MSKSSAQVSESRSLRLTRAVEAPERIWVVDEDAPFSDQVVRMLRRHGFAVEQRAELMASAAAVAPPHVLLLQLRGATLVQLTRVRERAGWADVPVICLAQPDDVGLRVLALDLGANDFVVKPVAVDELVARVRVQLRLWRRLNTLIDQAHLDPLTGLLNRRGLLLQLGKSLAHARRSGEPAALLLLDLDGFKPVNDTLGHAVGDEVLAAVGQALSTCARVEDSVGRLGGDEFVVVLPRADEAGAAVVVQRIRAALAGLRIPGDLPLHASVGVVLCTADRSGAASTILGAEEALAMADQRMYEDKRRRRGSKRGALRLVESGEMQK